MPQPYTDKARFPIWRNASCAVDVSIAIAVLLTDAWELMGSIERMPAWQRPRLPEAARDLVHAASMAREASLDDDNTKLGHHVDGARDAIRLKMGGLNSVIGGRGIFQWESEEASEWHTLLELACTPTCAEDVTGAATMSSFFGCEYDVKTSCTACDVKLDTLSTNLAEHGRARFLQITLNPDAATLEQCIDLSLTAAILLDDNLLKAAELSHASAHAHAAPQCPGQASVRIALGHSSAARIVIVDPPFDGSPNLQLAQRLIKDTLVIAEQPLDLKGVVYRSLRNGVPHFTAELKFGDRVGYYDSIRRETMVGRKKTTKPILEWRPDTHWLFQTNDRRGHTQAEAFCVVGLIFMARA